MKRLKILVEMKHGLGDCVCMLPAIRAVRYKFPDAYIALLVNGKPMKKSFVIAEFGLIDITILA